MLERLLTCLIWQDRTKHQTIITSLLTQVGVINRKKGHAKKRVIPKIPSLESLGSKAQLYRMCLLSRRLHVRTIDFTRRFLHRTRTSIFQGTLNESLTRIPGLQSVDLSLLTVAIIHIARNQPLKPVEPDILSATSGFIPKSLDRGEEG